MGNFIERPRYTCALGGAIAAAGALPRTIPILHAPPGCAGNSAWTQAGGCGLQVGGYCGGLSMPGSNVQEREVVFGGADRLDEQIKNTLDVMDGDLFIVLTSCVTEVIGDDVNAAVNKFRAAGVNIISAETGGFKGNSYLGYELVLESIWTQLVPVSGQTIRGKVNLWGIPPFYDVFWRGNLAGLRQLLAELSLETNTFFTPDDSLAGISQAGMAELNIVVSDTYGLRAAELSREKHGIPYISLPLPIGPSASNEFLTTVGLALGLGQEAIDAAVNRFNKRYYQLLDPITDCFNDLDLQRYAVVVGDANYTTAISRFLIDDLGWLPKLAVITNLIGETEQQRLADRFTTLPSGLQPELIFATDTNEIKQLVKEYWRSKQSQSGKYANLLTPAFVIGSSLERELAKDINAAHLSVSFPVANRAVINRGYTGYTGGLHLIEDLISTIIAVR
jgi:nitrogenase molybdenum-iron protein beta chain